MAAFRSNKAFLSLTFCAKEKTSVWQLFFELSHLGLITGLERFIGERNSTPVFLPRKFQGQRSLGLQRAGRD